MKTKMKGANIAMWSLLFMNLLSNSITAHADVVMDWNIVARDIIVDSKLNTPLANRAVAIVHTAVYEAVNSITQEYPGSGSDLEAVKNASRSRRQALSVCGLLFLNKEK
ncbi:MAG: hypothetical protein JKX81_08220 [Arenicella sp.]|nr:hypothetical protein [Arenicella sp.]